MAEFETVRRGAGALAGAVDQGLRAHMNKVYGLMAVAMVVTGMVSYAFGMELKSLMTTGATNILPEGLLISLFTTPLRWVVIFAPLAMVFLFGAAINRLSQAGAQMFFYVYAGLVGLSLSTIFVVYTGMSIAQIFFVTAIAFASLSLWGYTTKKDISGWGSFLIMGVVGLIVASLVNLWLQSEAIMFAVSALGVLIFAGLTAYDTQRIKNTYLQMRMSPEGEAFLGKAAILGALNLYLDFINMFIFLLQLFGSRE